MSTTVTNVTYPVLAVREGYINASIYATGGFRLDAKSFGLSQMLDVEVPANSGFVFWPVISSDSTYCDLKMLYSPAVPATAVTGTLNQGAGGFTVSASTATRIYTGVVTGTIKTPYASITLSQATSGATATVSAYNATATPSFDITPTGTFDTTHIVTGTNADASTFTFTPTMITKVWGPITGSTPVQLVSGLSNTGQILDVVGTTTTLTANFIRLIDPTHVETLLSSGWTSIALTYFVVPTVASLTTAISVKDPLAEVANGLSTGITSLKVRAWGY